MEVRERLRLIRLSEQLAEHRAYAQALGVSVVLQKKESKPTKGGEGRSAL